MGKRADTIFLLTKDSWVNIVKSKNGAETENNGGKNMSDLKAMEYKKFEDIKVIRSDGSEYWPARELAPVLDYVKWENFSKVINRAMLACQNSGYEITDHFPDVRKMVDIGSGTKRRVKDL